LNETHLENQECEEEGEHHSSLYSTKRWHIAFQGSSSEHGFEPPI